MKLPEYVALCIRRLEEAGCACYAVGGCVRDALLGLTPQDYDLCTAAAPETTRALFSDRSLVLAGIKHGTVGVCFPEGVVEITTFRRESEYRDHRHPDRVDFVSDITEDLARRDFTVNAMAYSPTRGYCDPFGGREDLDSRILRAVGDPGLRFREDALRILRGARFAARFSLAPEAGTLEAMLSLAPLMEGLARERVFSELCKLLEAAGAEDLLRFGPVITQAIPELGPAVGFCQHSPYHKYDVFTHTAYVTAAVPAEPALKWAALLHDVGKPATFTRDDRGQGHFYGHAKESAAMAGRILLRLKAPTALRERVQLLIAQHMTCLHPDRKLLRRRLSRQGEETVLQLLCLQEADQGSKGQEKDPRFGEIRELLSQLMEENACLQIKDLAVGGRELMDLGLAGPAIGRTLQYLLEQVMEEILPNEKEPLLRAAKERL